MLAAKHESEPIAVFRLVHVVRGDENGHTLHNFGEIRVLEIGAEGDNAGFLLLDVDKVERFIVQDDLDYRNRMILRIVRRSDWRLRRRVSELAKYGATRVPGSPRGCASGRSDAAFAEPSLRSDGCARE